jgi:hypothetical protein
MWEKTDEVGHGAPAIQHSDCWLKSGHVRARRTSSSPAFDGLLVSATDLKQARSEIQRLRDRDKGFPLNRLSRELIPGRLKQPLHAVQRQPPRSASFLPRRTPCKRFEPVERPKRRWDSRTVNSELTQTRRLPMLMLFGRIQHEQIPENMHAKLIECASFMVPAGDLEEVRRVLDRIVAGWRDWPQEARENVIENLEEILSSIDCPRFFRSGR